VKVCHDADHWAAQLAHCDQRIVEALTRCDDEELRDVAESELFGREAGCPHCGYTANDERTLNYGGRP
jgi:hypothetical protein